MDLADFAFGEVGVNDLGQKFLSAIVAFPLSGHSKPGITRFIPLIIHYFPLSFKWKAEVPPVFGVVLRKSFPCLPLFAKKAKFMLDILHRILYNNQAFSECDR